MLRNCFFGTRNKRRLIEKVRRRIAADGEFRKENEIGATIRRPTRKVQNLLYVAGEIADSGIDLSERNLHSSSLAMLELAMNLLPDKRNRYRPFAGRNRRCAQCQQIALAFVVAQLRGAKPVRKQAHLHM